MKYQRALSRLAFTAATMILLGACNLPVQQAALGGTRAWLDVPRDRSVLSLKPHEVLAHASDAGGLRQVELIVNGSTIGAMTCENLALPLVTCRVMWSPFAPGEYRLEARATNSGGSFGMSAPVYVSIDGSRAPSATITAAPIFTAVTPTNTSTSTSTATTVSVPTVPALTVVKTPTKTSLPPPPQTAPAAPSKVLQVSRSCTNPDVITIAWNDNSKNESGFHIYRRARHPDTKWVLAATVGANITQYADAHPFSRFKAIEYAVEAFNDGGVSARATLSVGECID